MFSVVGTEFNMPDVCEQHGLVTDAKVELIPENFGCAVCAISISRFKPYVLKII